MSALIIKAANEFSTLFLGTTRSDDSAGDRVSYRYTCAILIAFTVIVSNREFTSKRIQCWVPAFFNGNYEDYTNNVCWVRNTYYVDDSSQIPESPDIRRDSSIRYYQWIPFILLFQAFFFFLPYLFWRSLCPRSGIDIRDIVEAATNYKKANDEKQRDRLMKFIISVIDQYVDDPRRQSDNRETSWLKKIILMYSPSSGRYMGDYLRNLFITVKLCYLANVIGQIALLSALLGQPFWSLGFTVIRLLYEGKGWDFTSRYFPKVTLCDFQIREANALPIAHTYTVMCVLPINLFNQQIFTFLWFWFVLVIFATIYDLCIWVYRLFFRRETYLLERLNVMDYELSQQYPFEDPCSNYFNIDDNERLLQMRSRDEPTGPGQVDLELSDGTTIHDKARVFTIPEKVYKAKRSTLFQFFNEEYLEADGHFILRIIGTNASEFVSTIMIEKLYKECCRKRFKPKKVLINRSCSRTVLNKYIVIPNQDDPKPPRDNPQTPDIESRPQRNPMEELVRHPQYDSPTNYQNQGFKRNITSHNNDKESEYRRRPRSGTLPFSAHGENLEQISTMRSGYMPPGAFTALHQQDEDQQDERNQAL